MKYDREYLTTSIKVLEDSLEYLEEWSAYNEDEYNSEITTIRNILETLRNKIFN